MSGTVGQTLLRDLREHVKGGVLVPGDEAYEEARTLFNAMIDVRPAAIAQCSSVADVQGALRYARETGIEIAVRSGGHAVAGTSTVPDGLVVDVRGLKGVEVDAERRIARCGGGVTWAEFDRATQEHGL